MATYADRGKWAEAEVEKVLRRMNEQHYGFAYDRQPDARSARGAIKAALCDYFWWWKYDGGDGREHRVSGLLEVKETKHDYRLTKDKVDQLPRMRKVRNAGGYGLVLVYHSTLNVWRSVPLSFFDGDIPPSWDLSGCPTYPTAEAAMLYWRGLFPYVTSAHKEKNKC